MMQLFYSPASPFARKVLVLLHETGRMGEVALRHAQGSPTNSVDMPVRENPLGKLPVLVREGGEPLYDSRVITRYLDATGKGGFYPDDALWDVLTIEATADGIMDAGVLMVYELRCRPEAEQSQDWIDAQWEKIARALDVLDSRWIRQLNRAPDALDMGQIAVGCALGYLDFRHHARNWRNGRGALDDWFATFSTRDSMAATAPG